ncbi:MAG TPA: ArnT family glycosyltransferase [Candidatus Wunengus sp. YC65]|uniref:ArnT family glycosyltransferase n=1 Tax=Candidatus Wunengus sp. YC65 TaxID=3367701 RepID=UPI004026B71D
MKKNESTFKEVTLSTFEFRMNQPNRAFPLFWMGLISLLWLILNLPFFTIYPAPNGDETQISSISAEYATYGNFGMPTWGDIYGSSKSFLSWHLYNFGLAIFFKIFGVGFIQARVFSLIGVLVGGWLLFFLGQKLYEPQVGILAAISYIFSLRVFGMGHIARPEMWVNAGSIAALFMCWQLTKSRHPFHAFLAGVLTTLIVDIYMTAVYMCIAISILTFIEFRKKSDWKILAGFMLGTLSGTLYWFLVRLFPNPVTAGQWFSLINAISHNQNITWIDRILFIPEIVRGGFLGSSRIGLLESVYMFIGIASLVVRRKKQDIFLFICWAMLTTGFVLFYSGNHHIVDLMPLFSLAIAAALSSFANKFVFTFPNLRLNNSVVAGLITMPLIAGYIGSSIYVGWQNRIINYQQYANELRRLVPTKSSVFGEGTWWWELRDGLYTADEYLLFPGVVPTDSTADSILQSILFERKVEVILLDERLGYVYLENLRPDLYNSLTNYAKIKCGLAGTVEGYAYGVEQGGPAIKRTKVYLCPTPQ